MRTHHSYQIHKNSEGGKFVHQCNTIKLSHALEQVNNMSERDIAIAAAHVLRECFIKAAKNHTVLYVENDNLMSKAPDEAPIFIKKIKGRNPNIAKKFSNKKTFKIKKRCIE